ncbi:MAG: type II secretion system protein [Candidatus Eremiobacteraeota bacterium]|nr:type II secretion system protein [Candidatus Eremiobacteraeota bacterium]
MRRKALARGLTLIEIIVVLSIMAIIGAITFARFNLYETSMAVRSSAQLMQADLKLQEQKASTLEQTHGIMVAPFLYPNEYHLFYKDSCGSVHYGKKVNFKSLFNKNVCIHLAIEPVAEIPVEFNPWSSGSESGGTYIPNVNEWSVAKRSGPQEIFIEGGKLRVTVNIGDDGRITLKETEIP